ncbi:GntR family transcriptional regulator [Verticiella sediminum]|uniref:GntR family transcriptional regulator n=1 Tax=Verticiella sediminum TaxID=1247510 RepID=A0A556A5Z7_9BURK|nr:GntR family transcriptional regulator [Verticiella sediminum]TSH88284.1 GntR family transcriptional regulator [Verticiella sediminum]
MAEIPRTTLKVDRSGKTLRELTLDKMREAIWAGHFRPGDRLVERSLCEQLGVSRSIVREVLRHLEAEGLVESVAHHGPAVARLSAEQAAQIYEIRALLEGQAARRCAETADNAAIDALAGLNARIQEAFAAGDHLAVMNRTAAFYERLFLEAGMTVAWDVVQSLNARITHLRALTIGSSGRRGDAAAEMGRLIDALRQHDAQAAQQASQEHVQRVAQIAARQLAALA